MPTRQLPWAAAMSIWDYAKHFQSTDDAFIVVRQTALAPKGIRLYHRRPCHRQRARHHRRCDRPH